MFITKPDGAKSSSVEEFNALSRATEVNLETLSGEFDALHARMQTSKARAGVNDAFHASSKELGRAAVGAARKRGCDSLHPVHLLHRNGHEFGSRH